MTMDPTRQLTDVELSSRLTRETVNHPITLASGVVSVLGGSAAVLFATSESFLLLAGAAGVGIATCIGWVMNKTVFGRQRAMLKIIEKVRLETRKQRQEVADTVEQGLGQFKDEPGLRQLFQVHEKFAAFENVLNLQFDRDELTHKRYLTTAEQLYFGTVDNLRNMVVLQHGVNAIDSKHINSQLADSAIDEQTKNTLKERLTIFNKAKEDRVQILAVNEQVMTKMDELTSKLGSIQTREGLSEVSMDTAMREIMHLINRTEQYDIKNRQ